MKTLRLLLLVLLAVLLPMRGVLAAAMPCANAHAVHGVAMPGLESTTAPHHHAHGHEHTAPASADTCHLCAACCAGSWVASLPVPAIIASLPVGASSFADPQVPAVSFVSGGPERPPRTC